MASVSASSKSRSASDTAVVDLPSTNRRNWLIHTRFVRRELAPCRSLIKEQLDATNGMCLMAVFVQGLILREEGRLQESFEMFQRCRQMDPFSGDNAKEVARALFLLGKYDLALAMFDQAMQMCCDEPDWNMPYNKALCHVHLGDLARATDQLTESLQCHHQQQQLQLPEQLQWRCHQLLASVALKQNNTDRAITVYQQAIEQFPDNANLVCALGVLCQQCGRPQEALQQLSLALALRPQHAHTLLSTGCVLQSLGDHNAALGKYKAAYSDYRESPALWNNVAMCYYSKKQYIACISCLRRANYLSPLDGATLYNLGLVYTAMRRYATAFRYLSAALNDGEPTAPLLSLLAVTLTHLGDNDNARHAYHMAVKMAPASLEIALNYAIFLHRIGCSDECRQQMALLDKLIQSNQSARTAIDHRVIDASIRLKSRLELAK